MAVTEEKEKEIEREAKTHALIQRTGDDGASEIAQPDGERFCGALKIDLLLDADCERRKSRLCLDSPAPFAGADPRFDKLGTSRRLHDESLCDERCWHDHD